MRYAVCLKYYWAICFKFPLKSFSLLGEILAIWSLILSLQRWGTRNADFIGKGFAHGPGRQGLGSCCILISGSSVVCSSYVFMRASGQSWLAASRKACAHLEPMKSTQNGYEMKSRFLKSKQRGRIFLACVCVYWVLRIYMCVGTCVCRCTCCSCLWKPEVDIRCPPWLLPYAKAESLPETRAHLSATVATHLFAGIFCLYLPHWDYMWVQCPPSASTSHIGITCKCNAHLLPLPTTLGLHASAMPTFYLCLPHQGYMQVQCPPGFFVSSGNLNPSLPLDCPASTLHTKSSPLPSS